LLLFGIRERSFRSELLNFLSLRTSWLPWEGTRSDQIYDRRYHAAQQEAKQKPVVKNSEIQRLDKGMQPNR